MAQVFDMGIDGILNTLQGSVWTDEADFDKDRDGLQLKVPAKALADVQATLEKAKAEGKKAK